MAKSKKSEGQLRAVGYCRTSGEGQRDNTSIPRQKEAIEAFCDRNGWDFQEHYVDECKSGSKIEGREDFQRMMRDAAVDRFDVLVPFDASRLARDGVDGVSTAKLLKDAYGIVTVDSKQQFDTRDYRNALRNFVQFGVSEHERLTIMDRMIGGKVSRAQKDNIPTSGRRPWGRTFNRETNEWGLDKEKQKLIEEIADRFLAGESLRELAEEFPLSYSQLHKILKHGCGDTWTVNYRVPLIDLEETVTHKVPRLLPEKTIRAVHRRLNANQRKSTRAVHDYLLGGIVFCAGCGMTLTGAVTKNGTRKYRHNYRGKAECPFDPKPHVRADWVEAAVINNLFATLHDQKRLELATRAAVPERKKAIDDIASIEKRLQQFESGRDSILELVVGGTLTQSQAKSKLQDLNHREGILRERLELTREFVAQMSEIEDFTDFLNRNMFDEHDTLDLPPEMKGLEGEAYALGMAKLRGEKLQRLFADRELKNLLQSHFEGSMPDGSKSGIYVTPADGGQRGSKAFEYELRGRLVGVQKVATGSRSFDRRR